MDAQLIGKIYESGFAPESWPDEGLAASSILMRRRLRLRDISHQRNPGDGGILELAPTKPEVLA
jgi:hypothetical protein